MVVPTYLYILTLRTVTYYILRMSCGVLVISINFVFHMFSDIP